MVSTLCNAELCCTRLCCDENVDPTIVSLQNCGPNCLFKITDSWKVVGEHKSAAHISSKNISSENDVIIGK